jgi:hypothetical protein
MKLTDEQRYKITISLIILAVFLAQIFLYLITWNFFNCTCNELCTEYAHSGKCLNYRIDSYNPYVTSLSINESEYFQTDDIIKDITELK